ncbi:MAG: TonB-dependent receptor [Bacteroidetes bacterium]|nr:TonB-dependent receptor [Bacteroidota bacterium]
MGFVSVDGFLKHITNLIFPVQRYIIDPSQYPGVPLGTTYVGKPIYTYINNPYPIDDYGVEFDWQTHLWYLPGPLSGLVLSANYTHIFSSAKYLNTYEIAHTPTTRGGHTTYTEIDSFYAERLIDQPNDIANMAVGYDYRGFSIRVSMIYSSNVFTGENFHPELRTSTATYVRWDLAAKQNLPWKGMQVYFDLNNINGENDISLIQGNGFPSSEQDYGMTADLGIRLAI